MGDAIAQFSSDLVSQDWRWYCKRDYNIHRSLCWDNKSKLLNILLTSLIVIQSSHMFFAIYNRPMQIICGFFLH